MSYLTSLAELAEDAVRSFHISPLDWVLLFLLLAGTFVSHLLRMFRLCCEEYAEFSNWWADFKDRRKKGP